MTGVDCRCAKNNLILFRFISSMLECFGGVDLEEVVEAVQVERKPTEEFMLEGSDCVVNEEGGFLITILDQQLARWLLHDPRS